MEPKKNCNICNRLVDYRNQNKILFPDFYNNRILGIEPLSSEPNCWFGAWVGRGK